MAAAGNSRPPRASCSRRPSAAQRVAARPPRSQSCSSSTAWTCTLMPRGRPRGRWMSCCATS
eukprot:9311695-Alexandrium_andersonii.AAC.1